MIMSDVFFGLFLILGLMICTVGYWLLAYALFPSRVRHAGRAYAERPWRITAIGAVIAIPGLFLAAALLQAPAGPIKVAGFALLFGLVFTGLVGSAGLAGLVGSRLPSGGDEQAPWRAVLRGGVVLTITFVLPGLGWFVMLPLTLMSGVGAVASALAASRRAPAPAFDNVSEAIQL